jgi:hypothetical protein
MEEDCFYKGGIMGYLRNPSRPQLRKNRIVPQLESLEDRNCPSFVAVDGHTLLIIGDNMANTISVMDSGNGMVTGTIDGQSATGTTIHNVVIHSGGGDDTLTYTLTNPLTTSEHLQINMGSGKDTATLDFSPGIMDTRLKVDFSGKGGDDTLTTKVGPIMDARVNFRANLGKGADTFDGTLLGNIMGDSAVRFLVQGGKGADTLGFHAASTNIDAGASLNVNLLGGKGDDTINFDYTGVVLGQLRLNADGGKGNDTIKATVTLNAGSTGEFRGRVKGGQGTNNLTFNVMDNSGGMADVDAFLLTHQGDTVTNTPNVVVVQPHEDHGDHGDQGNQGNQGGQGHQGNQGNQD